MEFDIKSFKFNFVEKPIILMICFAVLINYLITSIYVFLKYDITFKEKE